MGWADSGLWLWGTLRLVELGHLAVPNHSPLWLIFQSLKTPCDILAGGFQVKQWVRPPECGTLWMALYSGLGTLKQ